MIWGDKGWDLFDLYFLLLHRILIILHYNLYNLGILLHNTRTSLQRLASSKQPITEDDLFPDVENLNALYINYEVHLIHFNHDLSWSFLNLFNSSSSVNVEEKIITNVRLVFSLCYIFTSVQYWYWHYYSMDIN